MAQQLFIKFVDNDGCDEDRTPFLMLWQLWGGYTMPALKTVQMILELLHRTGGVVSRVMHKPNHKDELADLLVYIINMQRHTWLPYCAKEVEGLGYTLEDDRESFLKMTKLVLLANGLPRSAALIDKDTAWDAGGTLLATEETINSKLWSSKMVGDIFDVEIGLDSDAVPRVTFRVMDAFEPDAETMEKEYEKSDDVFMCKGSLKKYCGEMSVATWNEFARLVDMADTRGYRFLANKEENLVLDLKY